MFESSFNIDNLGKGNSFIHNLHPGAKVVIALGAILLNAMISSPLFSLMITIIFLILLVLARIDFKIFFKGYVVIIYFTIGLIISYAIFVGFSLMMMFTVWINLTSMAMPVFFLMFTSPILQTLYGLEFLMHPLNYIKLPVNAIILICTIALSFIPILVSEVQRILYAMAVRGQDIRYAPIKEKIKIAVAVLIPLLISTLNRSETLASAIAVKNYDAWSPRSNILSVKWKLIDSIFILVVILSFYVSTILIK